MIVLLEVYIDFQSNQSQAWHFGLPVKSIRATSILSLKQELLDQVHCLPSRLPLVVRDDQVIDELWPRLSFIEMPMTRVSVHLFDYD